MRSKTVAIIQGRMAASRLPGKVLIDLAGKPMLERVLNRAGRARTLDLLVVATTTDPSDDPVEAYCLANRFPIFRGNMFDVLDRFYQAARKFEAGTIVRITGDCPVVDPGLIDRTVDLLAQDDSLDFSCNRLPPPWKRTFPIGLDVEACPFHVLERAWKEADQKHQREHVMPYIYEGVQFDRDLLPVAHAASARGFSIAQLNHDPDLGSLRWTVDTPQDLDLMRSVFTFFDRDDFTWQELHALQQAHPQMFSVNAGVEHRSAFDVDERSQKDQDA